MDCRQHPGTKAVSNCAGCAESFCPSCVVSIRGKAYCASCKGMAIAPDAGPTGVCEEANEALKYAIVGLLCFGFILGPMAIIKGLAAKKVMAGNPRLEGQGKATAAIVVGSVATILNIIGLIIKFGNIGNSRSGF